MGLTDWGLGSRADILGLDIEGWGVGLTDYGPPRPYETDTLSTGQINIATFRKRS